MHCVFFRMGSSSYRACFSFHSSYLEVKKMPAFNYILITWYKHEYIVSPCLFPVIRLRTSWPTSVLLTSTLMSFLWARPWRSSQSCKNWTFFCTVLYHLVTITYRVFKFRLKPLCRKYCGREEIVYKPLGALKRTRKRRTSEGKSSFVLQNKQ